MIELTVGTFAVLMFFAVVGGLFLLAILIGLLIGQLIARGKRQEERARRDQLLRETGLK